MRALAVDWSGATHSMRSRIWLAEAVYPGRLVRLEVISDRSAVVERLLSAAGRTASRSLNGDSVPGAAGRPVSAASSVERSNSVAALQLECVTIGLDFAFSFPTWFVEQAGVSSAPGLWAYVERCGESWLTACEPPFWGRPGRPRPVAARLAFRRTELAVPRVRGIGPKSIFQIGGAGSVGTGSIRGMPVLRQLLDAGATIWPCTSAGGWPVVVEIYPRLLTGGVRKSNALERQKLLAERYPLLLAEHVGIAVRSEDAFDAAISALVMVEHLDDLCALPDEPDPQLRVEGRIWHPDWRLDKP